MTGYADKKIELLKQCLNISEDMLSNIKNLEKFDDLLNKRSEIIKTLQSLENENSTESCSYTQKSQIDHLVKLITSLDNDVTKQIRDEQNKVIESMKVNYKEQKIASYTAYKNL